MVGVTADRVIVELEAKVDRYIARVNQAEARFDRGMAGMRGSALRTETAVNRSFSNIGLAFGGLTASLGVREIARYADTWTQAGNQIAAAAQISGRSARSLSEIGDIADRTRSSIRETTNLYARLLRSTADVAKSEEEVARATEIVNQAFVAGGASASERAAGVLQLGQALGSGFLQGDELRSIRENAPLLAQAIADEFDTTIGKLKELGAEGEITYDRVFRAILNAQEPIEAAFATTNATIAESFTRLQNSLIEYVGLGDSSSQTTAKIATALEALADNIDIAVVAGVALGSKFIGPILLTQLGRAVGGIRAASLALSGMSTGAASAAASLGLVRGVLGLLGGPVGLAITAFTALPLVLSDTGDKIADLQSASGQALTALDSYAEASRRAAEEQDKLGGSVQQATLKMLEQSRIELRRALDQQTSANDSLLGDIIGDGLFDRSEVTAISSFIENEIERIKGFGGENAFLENIAEQLRGLQDGTANVQDLADALSRVQSVGVEAQRITDAVFGATTVEEIRAAREELIRYAEAAGVFSDELAAIENSSTPQEVGAAYTNLTNAIFDAAAASQALGEAGGEAFADSIRTLADGEKAAQALELALAGNVEEAQRIADELNGAASAGDALNDTNMGDGISNAADEAARLAGNLALAAQISARPGQISDLADEDAAFSVPVAPNSTTRRTNRRATTNLQRIARPRASSGGGGGSSSPSEADRIKEFQAALAESDQVLQRQLASVGQTSSALAGMRAQYALLDEAKRNDIDLDRKIGEQGETVRDLIKAQGDEVERLTELYENNTAALSFIEQGFDDIASATADALLSGESLRDGFKDILRGILSDILTSNIRESLTRLFQPTVVGGGGFLSGIAGVLGFERGGFTGEGARDEPAGIVHKGEYVFTKAETERLGVENLRRIAEGRLPGYMTGGLVGSAPTVSSTPGMSNGQANDATINLLLPPGLTTDQQNEVVQIAAGVSVRLVEQNNKAIPGMVANANVRGG